MDNGSKINIINSNILNLKILINGKRTSQNGMKNYIIKDFIGFLNEALSESADPGDLSVEVKFLNCILSLYLHLI
jgi:hypothetical protein